MSLVSSFTDQTTRQSRNRRRLIAASSAIVVIIVGVVTLITIERLRASRALVRHTLEVLQRTEALSSRLSDAETGQRGYLLTNDERYLAPYRASLKALDQDTSALRALTRDNPDHQRRLDALGPVIRAKLDELERTIALQRSGQASAAVDLVRSDAGKASMDSIRRILAAFTDDERQL